MLSMAVGAAVRQTEKVADAISAGVSQDGMAVETGNADCHGSRWQSLSHSRQCPLLSRLPPSVRLFGIAGRHVNEHDFLCWRGQIFVRLFTTKQLPIVFMRGYIECK